MDGYLRIGLLLVAGIIIFLILLEARMRKKRFKMMELATPDYADSIKPISIQENVIPEENVTINVTDIPEPLDEPVKLTITEPDNKFIVLSIFAKPNTQFVSYDLLQAISTTGMQFGEMNIFHYYLPRNQTDKKLFSLASATKPGSFNLDRMGDFSCAGLTLFMDIPGVPDPEFALNIMVKTAEQLADDLDGELFAGPHKPWSPEMLEQYRQKITKYKTAKTV